MAPLGAQVVSFPVEGSQEVPPVETDGSGSCDGRLNPLNTEYEISCNHTVFDAVAAHIHEAPAGTNGPIVFFLEPSTSFSFTVSEETLQQQVDDELPVVGISFEEFLSALQDGDLYVNVHTQANPGGEIRGQIPPPPSTLFFAQFGNGTLGQRSLTSDIVLLNSATTGDPVTGSITFHDEDGNPLPVAGLFGDGGGTTPGAISPAGAHVLDFSIDPLGDLTFSTTGMGDVVQGSALVASSGDLGGVVRFGITGIGVAGVGDSPVTDAAIVPVRRSGTLSTALAIRNTESSAITVDLSLRTGGMEVANTSFMLAPNARNSDFIEEYFEGTDTTDFTGSVVITADGGFAALALEFDAANGVNTTLPVTPIP